jgi:hypothetical protein
MVNTKKYFLIWCHQHSAQLVLQLALVVLHVIEAGLMLAVLLRHHLGLQTVLIPGLGTGMIVNIDST